MMTIAQYNRLVDAGGTPMPEVLRRLDEWFTREARVLREPFQPSVVHEIGLYDGAQWWSLRPKPGVFDPSDAAQDIDADIVQRLLFGQVMGIGDARSDRLTYVGSNRDAAWLQAEVDAGRHDCAVTLAPVTMAQFVGICMQNKLMPPKSTWFVPKIRSGLVMALLD